MRKARLVWTPEAKEDVREIRRTIARRAPKTAQAFVRRLTESVTRLRDFPEIGGVVEEFHDPDVRECLYGPYRIIYRWRPPVVHVLAVRHGAQLLGEAEVE